MVIELGLPAKILLFSLLLSLSAFFSGSETAIFSLSDVALQKMIDEKRKGAGRIRRLLKKPRRLLITILFGNTLVNVIIASLAAVITWDLCRRHGFSELWGLLIQILVVTFVILMVGEILPKIIAFRKAERLSRLVSRPIQWCVYLFSPLTFLLSGFSGAAHTAGGDSESHTVTEEEMKAMIEEGEDKGTIDEDEGEMLSSLFSFSDTSAKEIMIPRIDMKCLSDTATIRGALAVIREDGYSRIPIFRGSIDHIDSILYAKDLLKHLDPEERDRPVLNIAREAYTVPASKKIDDLLTEMRQRKVHIAIVVDEYGGTDGMVTLEDILEEIVGEIQDEHDEEEPLYTWTSPHIMLVNARMDLEDLGEELGLEFPEDEYESLGGLIFDIIEHVPEPGEEITYRHLTFIVNEVTDNRIGEVKIVVGEPEEDDRSDDGETE